MALRSIRWTVGTVGRAMIVATALIGHAHGAAVAGPSGDPLQCEALKLKCDSRYHTCLSRCDRVADRRTLHSPEDAEDMRRTCSDACGTRRFHTDLRLSQRPVCKGPADVAPAPANPQACAAQLLWVKANYMQCMARCHARFDRRPAFDCDGCVSECYDEYRSEVTTTDTDSICRNGPSDPVPVEPPPGSCAATN